MSEFITVNRLEFIVTYRCNSHCKHCQVGQDKRTSRPAVIDRELAVQIVSRVTEAYSPTSIMTFGGEPLLYPDVVCAIHKTAADNGIASRDVITNAGYPRSEAEFRDVAFRLADNGVNYIVISVDCFHQEYIPLAVVEQNVKCLVDAGIPELKWGPCWVVSKEHDNQWNQRTRDVLRSLEHLLVTGSGGNIVQPEGNALVWLKDFMPPKVPVPTGTCGDMPYTGRLDAVEGICIEPDGGVAVCNEFIIGNAGQVDIVEMLQNYNPYHIPEMKALLEGGVTELAEMASAKGVKIDPEGYYSICDMCQSIRREMATKMSL